MPDESEPANENPMNNSQRDPPTLKDANPQANTTTTCSSLTKNAHGILVHNLSHALSYLGPPLPLSPTGVNGLTQTLPLCLSCLNALMQRMDDN